MPSLSDFVHTDMGINENNCNKRCENIALINREVSTDHSSNI